MKLLFKTLIIFSLIAGIVSCSDFLEENPQGMLTTKGFYKTEADAIAAVDGIYYEIAHGWRMYGRDMNVLCALPTDVEKDGLGMPNQHLQNLEYNVYTSNNMWIENIWRNHYQLVSAANAAINNIPKVPEGKLTEDMRNRLLWEAHFLRGLGYFNLVRFFGDVPIILKVETVEDAEKPRDPVDKVYELVLSDLEFAQNNLPVSYDLNNFGRATKGAAKILEGKVHLTRHNYQECVDKLAEVVENESEYGYGLHEDFSDNWAPGDERGQEAVFSIDYGKPPLPDNGSMMALQGPKYSMPEYDEFGIHGNEADIPTEELYNDYEEGDERREVTLRKWFRGKNGEKYETTIPLFAKYWEDGLTNSGHGSCNFHVLRYADAVLMYAEALNEVGNSTEAENQLNRILERAFNNTDHNVSGLSREEFRDKVIFERKLELAMEANRWFDLVRTDKLVERMKEHGRVEGEYAEGYHADKSEITNNVAEHYKLFPIPQEEIDKNPLLEQNPGW